MKLSSYGLIALVIIAASAPTLALAQYENSEDDQGATMILTIFSMTLYVTISAVIAVVGYSIWKVYRIRRKAIKKIGVIFMQNFSNNSYLKILVISLVFVPAMVYADDNSGFSIAANLGWLAIGCGMAANLSLVIFKMVRKVPVMKLVGGSSTSQSLTPMYQPVLNFHIMINSIGFFAGFVHGFMFIQGLDYISLSLIIVMTISMISGIILRFTSGKNSKFISKLVHGQAILAALLVTLVVLHLITRWHHGIIMGFI